MKKYLIIVKFISPDDFIQLYKQLLTGQVVLPLSAVLPDQSSIILKLLIPMLNEPFLINGIIISSISDNRNNFEMTIDIKEEIKIILPEIGTRLAGNDHYKEIIDHTATETIEVTKIPDDFTGLEFEIDEDDSFLPDDDLRLEENDNFSADDNVLSESEWDYDLDNLRMENESDDSPLKVDLANQHDFAFLDDHASDLKLQEDADEIPNEDFSEIKLDVPCEFNIVSEDNSKTDKSDEIIDITTTRNLDSDSVEPFIETSEDKNSKGVLFEDLRSMVDQGELEYEVEETQDITVEKIPVKKDLTTEERQKAEPIGQFFMNLTKAMLRSGYYAPGHPGLNSAKAGLYEEFIGVLGDQREIMIANQNSNDGIDLMLTGILDEPISIRVLVGSGVADLFVPKLSEYCERKKLLSFALKKTIQADHFYQFIDIMSDPKVDDHKDKDAGTYLTNTFIEHGITDISTVFVDDMVKLESDLPWRVEMAIHRLAKDLKIMPMFKGVSKDAIKTMKLQTVQDIIRPLKHPSYLNDFLVNCYIIAKYVKSMPSKEIEEIVVDAFSIKLLLPTSQFTFKELDALKQLRVKRPDNKIIKRRLSGIKRILKLISRRVVIENESGAQNFLEQLYRNKILSFQELPADVQYVINTIKMADDIRENFIKYETGFDNINNPDDALIYLKCFRRTIPLIIEANDWHLISRMTALLKKVSTRKPVNTKKVHTGLKVFRSDHVDDFSETSLFKSLDAPERPIVFVFKDFVANIIAAYEQSDLKQRQIINQILNDLGSFGVGIISQMLSDSDDREVRKLSFEMLMDKGVQAKTWAVRMLEDKSRPWYIHRNAMMILGNVSDNEDDFAFIRNFLEHSNSKIREECLKVTVSLKPHDRESIILKAINDEDPKVSWRAMRSLHEFDPISESAINELLNIIALKTFKDKAAAEKHMNQTVHIISAINAMSHIPISRKVEIEVIDLIKSVAGESKSIWKKVKKAIGSDHETPLLKAAIPLLGKIGSNHSKSFLKKQVRSHPELSDSIKKAMQKIKSS